MRRKVETRTLLRNTVDIWHVPFSLSNDKVAALETLLNPSERERCRAFCFPKDQRRYAVSRGALRDILSQYVSIRPSEVEFGYEAFGKPFLASPQAARELQFNLSHCDDIALVAVGLKRAIGVDVERIRKVPDLGDILKSCFNQEDSQFVYSVEGEERARRFLIIWTRREAITKARGLDLSQVFAPLIVPSVVHTARTNVLQETDWYLQNLPLDSRHVGALCVGGAPCTLSFHKYEL